VPPSFRGWSSVISCSRYKAHAMGFRSLLVWTLADNRYNGFY
jgi:hypothetical protein